MVGFGRSHMLLGHFEEAEAVLREALKLDAASPKAHWFLGSTSIARDDGRSVG